MREKDKNTLTQGKRERLDLKSKTHYKYSSVGNFFFCVANFLCHSFEFKIENLFTYAKYGICLIKCILIGRINNSMSFTCQNLQKNNKIKNEYT